MTLSSMLDDGRTDERAAENEGGDEDDEEDDDDADRQGATPVVIRRSTHAREC